MQRKVAVAGGVSLVLLVSVADFSGVALKADDFLDSTNFRDAGSGKVFSGVALGNCGNGKKQHRAA